jgi:hypothetical protein
MNRLRFGIAQIGTKREAGRSLAMLLGVVDLAGSGWEMLEELTWRTGAIGSPTEGARRAGRAGSVTAWRSFEQAPSRWLWAEIIPYTSSGDAESAIPHLRPSFLPNPQTEVTVTAERTIGDQVVAGVTAPLVFEQTTAGSQGPSASRYVAGTVDRVVLIVACSGYADAWSWSDVVALAASQADKIRATLLESGA